MPITLEEVKAAVGGVVVRRPHFARVMLDKGYITNYHHAFDRYLDTQEYHDYMGNGHPTVERCIQVLKGAGGKVYTILGLACRQNGGEPLMYSQFCYHIQQDEQRRCATMHISRKLGEQIEVDWAGDPAYIVDPDTKEVTKAHIFAGVLSYSQYPYVETFISEQQAPLDHCPHSYV